MRAILMALAMVLSGAAWATGRLPIKEGQYSYYACGTPQAESLNGGIGYYKLADGASFISPNSEGIDAYCTISKINRRGNVFTGSAKCSAGGNRVRYDVGTYAFKYEIKSDSSFVSRDAIYQWCSPHR